jgi:N-acetylglutamate synthase-like GNAT family acetyltransferase
MDRSVLEAVLRDGEAEWTGVARRRRTLKVVKETLEGGVRSVNLCALDDLPNELFTYEGKGTLFTEEDYCRVERLGIDEFEEVERLIKRGQREGYLKVRTPEEIATLLLHGYGASIGDGHLAGICALETEPYRRERAGELVGLYTITRFKGEGVGARLVERVFADAADMGLRYVFACTTEDRAAAFFERQEFERVAPKDVPKVKWKKYDRKRLKRLHVLKREV